MWLKLAGMLADGQNYNQINMTFPLKIIGLLKTKVDTTAQFKFTINTALGTGDSFQLPLPIGQTYNFVVYWGDGNFDTITAYNQAETLHSYSSGGIYQIKIDGKCGGWSFNNGGDKLKIISVDQWGDVGFSYLLGAFYGCTNLTSIPEMLAADINVSNFTDTFRGCTNLASNINNVLNNTNINYYLRTFYQCGSITGTLPDFDTRTDITNFSAAFFGCASLTGSIPKFGNNTNITALNDTFNGCVGLNGTIPSDAISGLSNLTNLNTTFYNCSSLTGSIPVIPTSVSGMSSTFYGCSSITGAINSTHFGSNSNLTTMVGTFYGAGISGIASNTFSGCPNINTFYNCFRQNTNLQGNVPDFSSNTLVTNFGNCFYQCTGLDGTISDFSSNTAVTVYNNMFAGCASLTGSSQELWLTGDNTLSPPDYDSGTPTGADCYAGCTGLTDYATIPTYWK